MTTVKIILMTKDEPDLIEGFIHHHGRIFGYNNLHIIDDSTEESVLEFYTKNKDLGFNVYRFEGSNLNNLEHRINQIKDQIKNDCDFIIKLDTDEFILSYDKQSGSVVTDYEKILNSFNSIDRDTCHTTLAMSPVAEKNLPPLRFTRFSLPAYSRYRKCIFPTRSNLYIDLGGHGWGHNAKKSNVIIVHFHFQNLESWKKNNRKVLLSHGFILDSDSEQECINKLKKRLKDNPNMISHHKALNYLRILQKEITEENYKSYNIPDPSVHPTFDFNFFKENY